MAPPKGHKYSVGNHGGRPPVFKTPKALTKRVDEYFKYIEGEYHFDIKREKDEETGKITRIKIQVWDRFPEPATITGLTLFLGFANRQSLYDYGSNNKFSGIIARARTRVEHEYEKQLQGRSARGAAFALKQMGWADRQEVISTSTSTNTNVNYNTTLSPDEIRQISKTLEDEY